MININKLETPVSPTIIALSFEGTNIKPTAEIRGRQNNRINMIPSNSLIETPTQLIIC
tara:strand:- start:166 stop:339 length:174 start_codon:yes stop_codon:yes gene_type:complete